MSNTLISLILITAAISGQAEAWEPNGTGGQVELSGTLTPVDGKITPWESFTGDAVSGLDAELVTSAEVVTIPLTRVIPVLGIRTQASTAFPGQQGNSPQIDYQGNVDQDSFRNGVSTLTLDVVDANTPVQKIGTLIAPFTAAAVGSVNNSDISDRYSPLGHRMPDGVSGVGLESRGCR